MEIRRALVEELPTCANLVARGARETFTWMKLGDVALEFMAHTRDEEVYVAIDGGVIVGVAALYRPNSFVHYLFVEAGHRSTGVGGDLLAVVGSLADAPISLKVQIMNLRGRAFYEREGLEVFEQGQDRDGSSWVRMGHRSTSSAGRGKPGS